MRQQVPELNASGGLMEWARRVRISLNILTSGYPFMSLDADPASVAEGFAYYNTVSKTVRVFNGTIWVAL